MHEDMLCIEPRKKLSRPSVRMVIKYFLLQLPGQIVFILILLLVRKWLETPAYLLWGLLGFWVGKDIFLLKIYAYPYTF